MTITEEKTRENVNIAEENKEIIRRFIKAYNDRNLDVFDELVADDYFDNLFQQRGREPFRELFTMAFKGFPDWYEAIEDIVAEGDKVAYREICRGTHLGEFNGIPPTGKKVNWINTGILRIVDDRLAECWGTLDEFNLMQQLGAIPSQ